MLEQFFEKFLWNSRFVVLLAVISSLLLSVLMFVIATVDVFSLVMHIGDYFSVSDKSAFKNELVAHSVGAIDSFLLATILLIFSLGLYELFISKIEAAEKSEQSSQVLMINSLDDLKEKLAKVILMVLVVTFFEISLKMTFSTPLELIYFALGILFVALALYFTNKK
jgi:uncharacterized membrane protein YqhA